MTEEEKRWGYGRKVLRTTSSNSSLGEHIISKGLNIYEIATVTGDNEPEFVRIKSPNWCNDIYSVTKAFTATAVMMCCERGLLTVNDHVCDILADELPEKEMDPRWHDVTVHMALKHRTGTGKAVCSDKVSLCFRKRTVFWLTPDMVTINR